MDTIESQLQTDIPPVETPVQPKQKSVLLPLLLVLLAVVTASGYYLLQLQNAPVSEPIAAIPTPRPFFLTVDNLQEPSSAIYGELLVSGKTFAGASVAIVTDVDEAIVDSDEQGVFESTVLVNNGGMVKVTAYNDDGNEKEIAFTVAEDSAVLGVSDTNKGKGKQNETNSATTASATKQPVSAFGKLMKEQKQAVETQTVDILPKEKNELKRNSATAAADIKPVSKVTGQADRKKTETQIRSFLTEKKTVKLEKKIGAEKMVEILAKQASGSAEVAKSYKVTKMEAKVASAAAELKRHAVSGIITSIANGTITVIHQIHEDRITTVYYNANTAVTVKGIETATAADLKVGMRVTAAGIPADAGLLASKIHVIPGKAKGVFSRQPVASSAASPSPVATASASPSASPTTSPSAEPSASPSATPEN